MDATAALLTWMTFETLLFNAAEDGTASYSEKQMPEGSYCTAEFEGGLTVTLFDCYVMSVSYLSVRLGDTDVLMLTSGEDGNIYRADFTLDMHPEPAWLH